MSELEDKAKTGLERFYERYPNYPRTKYECLGVGAMMIPPQQLIKYNDK